MSDNHSALLKNYVETYIINSYWEPYVSDRWLSGKRKNSLHEAVIFGDIKNLEMLLDKDHDINAVDIFSCTPLRYAICYRTNELEIIKLLLSRGAHIDINDKYGMFPLHIATIKGYVQACELLLDHGACIDCLARSKYIDASASLHISSLQGNEHVTKLLLKRGADVNINTDGKKTPLYIAVERDRETIVKLLLEHGANVDAEDAGGKTILYLAVERGSPEIIAHILKSGPDVNNKNNRKSLNAAIFDYREGHRKILDDLLEYGFSIDSEEINNYKLLHRAVEVGALIVLEDLIKYGVNVNMPYNTTRYDGCSLLHIAINHKQEDVAKLLLRYGADVNAKDRSGRTSIFYAIESGDVNIAKLLLTNSADVKNNPDVLFTAVKYKRLAIIDIMLQQGANVNASNKYGSTPLYFTIDEIDDKFLLCYDLYETNTSGIKVEIAKLLLNRGANVEARTKVGQTILHCAAQSGSEKIVQLLLEHNADVNSVVNSVVDSNKTFNLPTYLENEYRKMFSESWTYVYTKCTALHIAAKVGYRGVAETLLKFGADVDFRGDQGETPLHIAVQEGHLPIVELLLSSNADIDSRDNQGRTPLHYTSKNKHAEVVKALLLCGSDINIMNKDNDTPFSAVVGACSKLTVIFQRHIIKSKAANLHVSQYNLRFVIANELNNLYRRCKTEIKRMRLENVSFYNILTKSMHRVVSYSRNETIARAIELGEHKAKYPIYRNMIDNRFEKGQKRKTLIDSNIISLNSLLSIQLPQVVILEIFAYVSNRDLENLNKSCTISYH